MGVKREAASAGRLEVPGLGEPSAIQRKVLEGKNKLGKTGESRAQVRAMRRRWVERQEHVCAGTSPQRQARGRQSDQKNIPNLDSFLWGNGNKDKNRESHY